MLSTFSSVTSGSIDAIDWPHITFIASGCSGVVYEVAPGVVAKVSPCIKPEEAGMQVLLAQEHLAMPVLGYAQGLRLLPAIRRAACSLHGARRWTGGPCTCDQPVDVLLMPRVERICTDDELDYSEVLILRERVRQLCWRVYRGMWDCHAGNLAVYQGRYVALDFGDMSNRLQSS